MAEETIREDEILAKADMLATDDNVIRYLGASTIIAMLDDIDTHGLEANGEYVCNLWEQHYGTQTGRNTKEVIKTYKIHLKCAQNEACPPISNANIYDEDDLLGWDDENLESQLN